MKELEELYDMARKTEKENKEKEEEERRDDEKTCSVCYEQYDEREHWKCVLTVCGHQFGESCLFRISESLNRAC